MAIAVVLLTCGCTTTDWYEVNREAGLRKCQDLVSRPEREQCEAGYLTYEEYVRARAKTDAGRPPR